MWWFLVLLGVLITLSGVSVIALGVSIFVSTIGNTLITTGAVAASGGLVIIAMGLVLRQMERLSQRIESAIASRPASPWRADEDEDEETQHAPPAFGTEHKPTRDQSDLTSSLTTPAPEAPRRGPSLAVEDLLPPQQDQEEDEPEAAPSPRMPRMAAPPPAADPMVEARRAHLAQRGEPTPRALAGAPAAPRPARTGYETPRIAEPKAPPAPVPPPAPAAPEAEEPRILKSGIVGGMAYTLYSDGSIQAELPDGVVRFASLQELRDHVARTQ